MIVRNTSIIAKAERKGTIGLISDKYIEHNTGLYVRNRRFTCSLCIDLCLSA